MQKVLAWATALTLGVSVELAHAQIKLPDPFPISDALLANALLSDGLKLESAEQGHLARKIYFTAACVLSHGKIRELERQQIKDMEESVAIKLELGQQNSAQVMSKRLAQVKAQYEVDTSSGLSWLEAYLKAIDAMAKKYPLSSSNYIKTANRAGIVIQLRKIGGMEFWRICTPLSDYPPPE